MKKFGSIIAVIAVIAIAFAGLTTILYFFAPAGIDGQSDLSVDDSYEITEADYHIVVGDDRTAEVTERISVKFYGDIAEPYSRGIVRYLPTNSGEQYSNINVECEGGDPFYVKSEMGYIGIYTGEDYNWKYKPGSSQTYTITYNIVPPVRTAGHSHYYMNVVPFGWTARQRDVSFTITFPYEIKDERVYAGAYGTTSLTNDYKIESDGKSLSMSGFNLPALNGVTVDIELGKSFKQVIDLSGVLAVCISIALLLIAVCVLLFAVKDRTVYPIINSAPPLDNGNELDPAQVGYLIDNNCEPQDVTALIFYFASKGFLELENEDESNIVIVKKRDLPTTELPHRQIIFNGLFKKGPRVTTEQLRNSFYVEIASATAYIKGSYSGKLNENFAKIVSVASASIGAVIMAIVSIAMAIRTSAAFRISNLISHLVLIVALAIGGFLFGKYIGDNKNKFSRKKLIMKCVIAAAIAFGLSVAGAYVALNGIFPFYGRIVLLFLTAVTSFVCGQIRRKTKYYSSLINEIAGFKTFLESAEKERLEMLLADNPQYYYDILPYANVLGVSDIWEEKFKDLENVPPPTYYSGNFFDFIIINSMFRSSFGSFTAAMISRPSGTSFGGRGGFGGFGGGFGGGGFGGGGGGRR